MPNTGFLGWAYISGSTVNIAGGLSDKQVNFMSGSTISGSSNATFDYTTNTLSASIVSGTFFGSAAGLTGVPAGSPGGSDTQVQFNDGGSTFEGAAALTYNKTTTGLTITGDVTSSGVRYYMHYAAYERNLYVSFIDLSKAFD